MTIIGMTESTPALVEPAVLRWAREAVDLIPVEAARRIGVADGQVSMWEAGSAVPTMLQLQGAATVYRRNLAVFFLAAPPSDFDPGWAVQVR